MLSSIIRSTFPLSFILISSMSLVISPTQLPTMFLSQSSTWIQLGIFWEPDWLEQLSLGSVFLKEVRSARNTDTNVHFTHTHTYTSRQSEEMALPKHKLHSMLARICIHSGLNNKDCFYWPTVQIFTFIFYYKHAHPTCTKKITCPGCHDNSSF